MFKVGDKVIIVTEGFESYHHFRIGEIGVIINVQKPLYDVQEIKSGMVQALTKGDFILCNSKKYKKKKIKIKNISYNISEPLKRLKENGICEEYINSLIKKYKVKI